MANPSWDDTEEVQSAAPSWEDTEESGPSVLDNAISSIAPTIQPLAETAQDFSVGAAQGATLGSADEIGGGLAALLEKGASYIPGTEANKTKQIDEQLKAQGFSVPEESLADSYRAYQKGSEQAFKNAADRSPIANTLGNITGSVPTSIALGGALGIGNQAKNAKSVYGVYKDSGKLKAGLDLLQKGGTTFAKAAPAIAAESALTSQGTLSDEQGREKLGEDVLSGLAYSAPAVLGLEGLTGLAVPAAKAGINAVDERFSKFVQDNPFMRKYGIGVKHGEMGTKPTTESGLKNLENLEKIRSRGTLDNIYSADKTLGKAVGKSIEDATKSGQTVDVAKSLGNTLDALDYSYNQLADIAENPRGRQIFEKIQKGATSLTPDEAKYLLNDVDAYRERFKAMRVPGPLVEERIIPALDKFRQTLSNQLKTEIPEYGQAAQRFTEFRRLIPETILSKDIPSDVSGVYMGNLRNVDSKLYKAIEDLQMGATAQGSGAKTGRQAYENLMKGMKEFELNEKIRNDELIKKGITPNDNPLVQSSDEFNKTMSGFSDEANFLRDIQTIKSPVITDTKQALSNIGGLGRTTLGTSLLVGKVKKPIADLSRKAYNLPAEKLNSLSQQMQQTPGLKVLGQALADGLQNGDQAKKNAAIFSILQNPDARLLINDDEE